MWLFVDAVTFAGDSQPWYIDGDEFSAAPSPADAANTQRYVEIITRAKRGEVDFGPCHRRMLDERNCTPYDPVYLRETLGGGNGAPDGGRGNGGGGMSETIRTVEALTGRQMVLTDDHAHAVAPARRRSRRTGSTAGCCCAIAVTRRGASWTRALARRWRPSARARSTT